ncbi:hypothetical protein BN1051_01048 [Arthrobacter saudimassiliensis]|uniref:Activator of Hsp90 ATPase homologue 1/2-like C-terminal domain-containing protein n=1 Tax=Arthrobacter saudimassiliensis TaxID=1461584 RepID=A0A078MQP6_9MICC|nr:hypothetical protein BN1051_01048 [Arthrobacter saudimassiliensis]
MTAPDPSTPVPSGRIEKLSDGYALAFDRQFDYPTAYIWDVLTAPAKVAAWLGRLSPGWEQGSAYRLDRQGTEVTGTVLQMNPRSSLQLTWEDDLGDESVVEWQVLDSEGGALLSFRARSDGADFLTEGAAGWQDILDAFASVAAGGQPGTGFALDTWLALRDAYAEEFGISPTMGTLHGDTILFERWFDAGAREATEAINDSTATLAIGAGAEVEVDDTADGSRAVVRQPLPAGGGDAPALLAAWHMALDDAALRLQGGTPHADSRRLAALRSFYGGVD